MNIFSRISTLGRALIEIGPRQLSLYSLYKFCLKSGIFLWAEKVQRKHSKAAHQQLRSCRLFFDLPELGTILQVIGDKEISNLRTEADNIVQGKVRLFGAEAVSLNLSPNNPLLHWTAYERGLDEGGDKGDIKFTWEPARFGWAFQLGRAYHVLGKEEYAEAFWRYFELFDEENPVNMGPNWISAQEIALRILAFSFAIHAFATSSHTTVNRRNKIALAIAKHAERIPITLIYAKAQNNNHLLSEAVGLITASRILPEHPDAKRWEKIGLKWFKHSLDKQINSDGAYIQQSTNYHRLMLQLVLWAKMVTRFDSKSVKGGQQKIIYGKIKNAVRWLQDLCDPETGRVPNLGPNDGAYIIPLTASEWEDYRPVLQASSFLFLGERMLTPGIWDEMCLWFAPGNAKDFMNQTNFLKTEKKSLNKAQTKVLKTNDAWGYFRAANLHGRPGHADQLNLDLWWRGINIAQDAGTYLYNGQSPWDNALTHTVVHNTIMIDGQEQMKRVSRFLYLNKARAKIVEREVSEDGSWERAVGQHDGYKHLGVIHEREVKAYESGKWVVEDFIQPMNNKALNVNHDIRLHWLLPDWEWGVQRVKSSQRMIELLSPLGWLRLGIQGEKTLFDSKIGMKFPMTETRLSSFDLQIIRCGELLYGSGEVSSIMGWISPTYGKKEPALSIAVLVEGILPISIVSEWVFPSG